MKYAFAPNNFLGECIKYVDKCQFDFITSKLQMKRS